MKEFGWSCSHLYKWIRTFRFQKWTEKVRFEGNWSCNLSSYWNGIKFKTRSNYLLKGGGELFTNLLSCIHPTAMFTNILYKMKIFVDCALAELLELNEGHSTWKNIYDSGDDKVSTCAKFGTGSTRGSWQSAWTITDAISVGYRVPSKATHWIWGTNFERIYHQRFCFGWWIVESEWSS